MDLNVAMPDHEVSHGDIYHKLGSLEGKVDSLTLGLTQKREDLADAFRRLNELEQAVAKWAGVAIAASIVIPLVVSAMTPRLHFGDPPAAARER